MTHEDSEKDRAIKQVERDVQVQLVAQLPIRDRSLEHPPAFFTARENEVMPKGLRELGLGIG
jgi:hypothetical protein